VARDQDSGTRDPVRTTIVGGQPQVRTKSSLPIPEGIERLIARAAGNASFRQRLLADREAAAKRARVDLTDSERLVLRSISDDQLAGIIDAVPASARAERRGFLQTALRGVGAWLAALVGGSAAVTAGCSRLPVGRGQTVGERPDMPPPPEDEPVEPKEPEPADGEGDAPPAEDEPPPITRGIEPDVPPPKPVTKGIQPDVPPERPMTLGIQPDVPPANRGSQPDVPPKSAE
jgi:hypothetical protein